MKVKNNGIKKKLSQQSISHYEQNYTCKHEGGLSTILFPKKQFYNEHRNTVLRILSPGTTAGARITKLVNALQNLPYNSVYVVNFDDTMECISD